RSRLPDKRRLGRVGPDDHRGVREIAGRLLLDLQADAGRAVEDEDVSSREVRFDVVVLDDRNVRDERIGIGHASGSIASISRVRSLICGAALLFLAGPTMSNRLGREREGARPPFLYVALAVGILTLAVLTIEGIHSVRFAGYSRVNGAVQYDPTYVSWVISYLLIAAAFYGVGMTMAVAKPESRTVQWGYASSLLTAAFLVWVATRPVDGIHHDALATVLSLSFPLDLIAALLFLDRFPQPVDAGPFWRRLIRGVIALACALWVARSLVILLHALEVTGPLVSAYEGIGPLLESLSAAGMLALLL